MRQTEVRTIEQLKQVAGRLRINIEQHLKDLYLSDVNVTIDMVDCVYLLRVYFDERDYFNLSALMQIAKEIEHVEHDWYICDYGRVRIVEGRIEYRLIINYSPKEDDKY